MVKMDTLTWEEPLTQRMKIERNLNFSTMSNEEDDYGFSRKKTTRDPMSHRIIEKRRRDRMNNCLADLSRLVPTNYLKKGRGRIEKTEIIEMAIRHLKHLQAHPCQDPGNCEVARTTEQDHKRQYRLGYQECMSETVRFIVESEGLFSGDGVCVRLIEHLQKHFDKVSGGCFAAADSKPSQLREMLTSPQHLPPPAAPPSHQEAYKFKSNIRHRFHNEQNEAHQWETTSSCGSNPSPPPNAARSTSSSGYSTDHRKTSSPSPPPGVPVFALHPKGTYYVPLTLDATLLHHYPADEPPVLHPVSICVDLAGHSPKMQHPDRHYYTS